MSSSSSTAHNDFDSESESNGTMMPSTETSSPRRSLQDHITIQELRRALGESRECEIRHLIADYDNKIWIGYTTHDLQDVNFSMRKYAEETHKAWLNSRARRAVRLRRKREKLDRKLEKMLRREEEEARMSEMKRKLLLIRRGEYGFDEGEMESKKRKKSVYDYRKLRR